MKAIIWIIVIVSIAGLLIYSWGKKAVSKLSFDIGFKGVDFRNALGSGLAQVSLSVSIDNKNGFSIPVSGLYAEVYYKGAMLAKSLAPQSTFVIPPNGSVSISHTMNVSLLSNAGQIVGNFIAGTPTGFEYMVKARLFNIVPFTYKGSFTY